MKLFSIKVNDGKVIVGLNEKVNDSTFKYEDYFIYELDGSYYVFDNIGKPTINPFKFIGTLSDVTEDMAKEWGFDDFIEVIGQSLINSKEQLILTIMKETLLEHNGLSNILLILVKDE